MNAHNRHPKSNRPHSDAFTLVEIMIVVVIIGLLAAMAIPAFARVQSQSKVSAFANDIRIGSQAFESYAMENGGWPVDGGGSIPATMAGYLNLAKFNGPTPLGGTWDWDNGVFGVTAGLSVRNPTVDSATMVLVDQQIDDGNLATGDFRARTGGYILVLEF